MVTQMLSGKQPLRSNFGLDATLFDRKLNVSSLMYWSRRTTDLLLNVPIALWCG